MEFRIQRVVTQTTLDDEERHGPALQYWLSRPPEERVAAVEYLRSRTLGSEARLLRVLRVVECLWG